MIEAQELSKYYQLEKTVVKAVDNVNLKVNPKEFVIIMGRSGSGKTTLLNLISGLTRPTAGTVYIEGNDIWSLSDKAQSMLRGQKIGFIFQFSSLISSLNVMDNLRIPTIFSKTKVDISDRAEELLKLVGLSEKMEAFPSQLSIGQQKKAAIARALMNNAEIILADEPTANLDEETEREIMQIIDKIHDRGSTVVLITHKPGLSHYASRRLKMVDGVLTEL